MGGADGFVSILRTGFGFEHMEFSVVVFLAIAPADEICGGSHGLIGKPQRVGTHIGNEAGGALAQNIHAFIQSH